MRDPISGLLVVFFLLFPFSLLFWVHLERSVMLCFGAFPLLWEAHGLKSFPTFGTGGSYFGFVQLNFNGHLTLGLSSVYLYLLK